GCRVNDRRLARYLDHLFGATNLQHHINVEHFIQMDVNALVQEFLESGLLDLYRVRSDGYLEEEIFARRARFGLAAYVGRFVNQLDLCADYDSTAWVRHRAADAAAGALGKESWRTKEGDKGKEGHVQNTVPQRSVERPLRFH